MTRIGADSVTLSKIPAAVDVAFYYVSGHFGISSQAVMQKAYPDSVVLGIDATGEAPSAAVRDWENGDKGGNLEQWVITHNKAAGRKDAAVYCNRSTIPEVRRLTGSQVLGRDYHLWVATLDGTLYTGPGVVACQVATVGGYDLSVIWDDGWHPSPSSVAHLKANILEWAQRLDGDLQALAANARRL